MIETSKSCHFSSPVPSVWLVDNGSLRPESILALREQASRLSRAAGIGVEAVSVLHSAKEPPEHLGGEPAATFTAHLRGRAAGGLQRLLVLPYFFGPSAALTDYLPQQIARVQQDFPQLQVQIAPPLVDLADPLDNAAAELAGILAEAVQAVLRPLQADCPASERQAVTVPEGSAARPAVVLVDHGSPLPAVSAVRNRVGEVLQSRLVGMVSAFGVCSMEAREGDAYAHTLPLLEQVLAAEPFCRGRVIVAPLFLSPGRHAGEGGDLWQIAERVRTVFPMLQVCFCALPGSSPAITGILLRRLQAAIHAFC